MKTSIALSALLLALSVATASADVGGACASAAENGDIELPEGMSAEVAASVCACLGENASGDVADEFMASLEIYDLDERMGSLSDEALAVFNSCAG